MTYPELVEIIGENGLSDFGTLRTQGAGETIVLLGPAPNFWSVFTGADEYQDGAPDPIDRWSKRVISALAKSLGARPEFPFGGPPYAPFLDWSRQSGRAFQSPVGMLVHDTAGLMVSYRGALVFDHDIGAPKPLGQHPCETCADKPCLTACPVGALSKDPYDVPKCKDFLQTQAGKTCMTSGCQTRMSCPLSKGAHRDPAQSAHHMQVFLGT